MPAQSNEPSRWEILARERNSRVILCHTPDTFVLIDIARMADRGIRALRNRLMISLTPDDVVPLLEKYNEAVINLHRVVEDICQRADIQYRTPRAITRMLKTKGNGNGAGEQPEAGETVEAEPTTPPEADSGQR